MKNIYDSSLFHHGIKGQKYGIRRYQNDDGSLTPEGRIRYGVGKKEEPNEIHKEYQKHNFYSDSKRVNRIIGRTALVAASSIVLGSYSEEIQRSMESILKMARRTPIRII